MKHKAGAALCSGRTDSHWLEARTRTMGAVFLLLASFGGKIKQRQKGKINSPRSIAAGRLLVSVGPGKLQTAQAEDGDREKVN